MVDYEWYRSFLAVYQVGTVTGAADERRLTQPAVTQHLAALEAAIGAPLFTRTARRMVPTERGKALYTEVVGALETLDRVSLGFKRAGPTPFPELRLGTPREYFATVGCAALAGAPIRLWVQFGSTRTLLEALQGGELDVVIATERLNLREIEYRKLGEESFILVAAPDADPPMQQPVLPAERQLLEAWALEQPWVSYGRDLPIIRRFWRQCFGSRPNIEPQLMVPDLLVLIDLIASRKALSVLPAYLCAQRIAAGQLATLWAPQPPVTNDIWLACRLRDRQRPEIMIARDALWSSHQSLTD